MGVYYITFFFSNAGGGNLRTFRIYEIKVPHLVFLLSLRHGGRGKGSFTLLPFYIFLKIKVLTYKISPDALTQEGSLTRHY